MASQYICGTRDTEQPRRNVWQFKLLIKRKSDFYHLSDHNIGNNIELEKEVLSNM